MSQIARWEKQLNHFVPEKSVKSSCIKLLRSWGLQVIRNNTGKFTKVYTSKRGGTHDNWAHCGLQGSGDLLVCGKKGRWIEIETKSTTGDQRPEQIVRQQYVESIGGLYILARSLDDLLAYHDEIMGRL